MIPIEKIESIVSRHDKIEKELSSGSIDPKTFAKKSKEYSDLGTVINIAREYLKFENFFSPKRCTINNYGGRISSGKFNNKDGIILTTGATGNEERHFAQDPNSHLGKILFFSLNDKS